MIWIRVRNIEGIVYLNKRYLPYTYIHTWCLCKKVMRHKKNEEKLEWVNFNYIPKNRAVDTNDMYNCQRQGSFNSIQHCLCSCINFSSNKKNIGEENRALRIHAAATRRRALFPIEKITWWDGIKENYFLRVHKYTHMIRKNSLDE